MKDPRLPEIALLVLIAVLVAGGGLIVLTFLAKNRVLGTVVTGIALVAAVGTIRRAYVPSSPTIRADVTRAACYCCAAFLALVAVLMHAHYGMPIVMAEAAIGFDIVSIIARPRLAGEQ